MLLQRFIDGVFATRIRSTLHCMLTKWRGRYGAVSAIIAAGRNVVLHCRQGIGRTGLVAACLFLTKGWDPETAVKLLSAARGTSVPETAEQRRWIDHYAARFFARTK